MEQSVPTISFKDFLDWEAIQDTRHELIAGRILAFAGASKDHNHIADNIHFALREFLQPPCVVYGNNVILQTLSRTGDNGLRPDVVVSCASEDASGTERYITVPRIVVEVRSPSNDDTEWKKKFEEYRNAPCIEQIVIVESQTRAIASIKDVEDLRFSKATL
jgi:Uma2 family endonuclease